MLLGSLHGLDGRDFEPPTNPANLAQQGHFGLMGICERALLIGGRMEAHSRPGAGTTLEVCLPLKNGLAGESVSLKDM